MAKITLNISKKLIDDIFEACSEGLNLPAEINKEQFVTQQIVDSIKRKVRHNKIDKQLAPIKAAIDAELADITAETKE